MNVLDSNKLLVKRYIEEVINTGNVEILSSFISEDYVETYQGKNYPLGREGACRHICEIREIFPDLSLSIEMQISEGEWVATSYWMTGTHTKEWIGIPPSGRKLKISGVNLNRVVNNLIVEHGGAANIFDAFKYEGLI